MGQGRGVEARHEACALFEQVQLRPHLHIEEGLGIPKWNESGIVPPARGRSATTPSVEPRLDPQNTPYTETTCANAFPKRIPMVESYPVTKLRYDTT